MCEEIGAAPSLPGTEAPPGGLDGCSVSSESSPNFQESQTPTHTPLLPGSTSHPPISLSLFCPQLS